MNPTQIESVKGYELLDSRGNPTVAACVTLSGGASGFAVVPSGASTGKYEAHELRDGDADRYFGKGVKKAVKNIDEKIAEELKGMNAARQRNVDNALLRLDKTENKTRLGANATLAVSLAAAKAAANAFSIPLYRYIGGIHGRLLPRPMMNILNGGAHAANNIDIQEFMIMPMEAGSFTESLQIGSEIYHTLGGILKQKGLLCGVGDEGGFAPELAGDEQAIDLICEAVIKAGYDTQKVKIALDIASSEWYENGVYHLPKRGITRTTDEMIRYFETLSGLYPLFSLEDGLADEDWEGWKSLTGALGNRLQLVGDDLFVTNIQRVELGIQTGCANAVLIKPNQIGTLTETLDVIAYAARHGYATVLSHRSGETEDSTIADIAVGVNAMQIKTGAPCRSDRVAKYNRLLVIEDNLS